MPFETQRRAKPKMIRKTISYRNLQAIHLCLNLPFEIGGSIDFDEKGRLLRTQLYPVNKLANEIILPDSLSVEFHSHPHPKLVQLPSLTDLMAQAKRSINTRLRRPKRFKQFRGDLAIVFNHFGAVIYKYNRKVLPSKLEQKEMLHILISLKRDSVPALQQQCRDLRKYGFDIALQTWPKIRRSGLYLKFCSRTFHRIATP
jgi:hypothetical protein